MYYAFSKACYPPERRQGTVCRNQGSNTSVTDPDPTPYKVAPGPGLRQFLSGMYTQYIKNLETYIIFYINNRNFKDRHFKLAGCLDWYEWYQKAEFNNLTGLVTICVLTSYNGTYKTKHRKQNVISKPCFLKLTDPQNGHTF